MAVKKILSIIGFPSNTIGTKILLNLSLTFRLIHFDICSVDLLNIEI